MQEFSQNEIISHQSFMNQKFHKLSFQYVPRKEDELAALNFHLTKREKQNIAGALQSEINAKSFKEFKSLSATPLAEK
jgi:hypothetical protein